ncbi:MAG TPA: molybdopterin-dependent oxidoreductase [Solirubrobacteraceae bacterium]|nr:molybdopterin-dependent oxidoreductase [Solirubrobacteraceae bacterium]
MAQSEQRITMCRICEAHCGMVATVEDGVVTKLRPDRQHPLSGGEACPKGIAMTDVQNDPDRVVHPLRRGPDGELHPVSWDVAIAEIGQRLRAVIDRHGPQSIGWYFGNPGAFSYSHALWAKGFAEGLGTPHYYTASSQDVANRFAASALLYGSPGLIPIPDLQRTSFLLMVGANPFVSHGSVLTAPKVKDQLRAIVARGGRVVVVDPRRTETARHFEHLPVRPDGDAWLLLSILQVLVAEGLADEQALAEQAEGWEWWREAVAAFPPEATAAHTAVEPDAVRALARDLAGADSAAVYGRTGSCLGRFGTLVAFLLDLVMLATGNLDRPGGGVFGLPAVALDEVAARAGLDTYGAVRSRIGGFPDVLGALPAALMAQEMTTPGPTRIRAFFTSAGNPVLSCPNGDELESALDGLDLFVSLDLYVNETNRHADYVLPATTWLERDDLPIAFLGFYTTPFVQYSEAVVAPRGEAREEWEIIDAISREIGVQPYALPVLRVLARLGYRMPPRRLLDLLLRTGREGDLFGLRRGGLSLRRLRARPHGVVVGESIPTGVLPDRIRSRSRRVQLGAPALRAELDRLAAAGDGDPDFPLRLIGLRELRSHNSWMHNAPLLMRGEREQPLRVHPQDAVRLGLEDGASARLASKSGTIEVPVRVSDEVLPGVVALPHGWGHAGGWQLANSAGGVNVNLLTSSAAGDLEPLAGMAFLNGVPVRLEPLVARGAAAQGAAVAAPA